MTRRHPPREVVPAPIARALIDAPPIWFVIGGQAVRCFSPYRPSEDVDFGVGRPSDLQRFLAELRARGKVEILERSKDTVHLIFEDIDVSIFVLPKIAPHVEEQALTLTGLLATKLHAILDRGTRRDFFDLYVLLEQHRLGIVECLRALDQVYDSDVEEGLLLRALTYFEDAETEAPLPGESERDWSLVKQFFIERAGALLIPPQHRLGIQEHSVGVNQDATKKRSSARRKTKRGSKRK